MIEDHNARYNDGEETYQLAVGFYSDLVGIQAKTTATHNKYDTLKILWMIHLFCEVHVNYLL